MTIRKNRTIRPPAERLSERVEPEPNSGCLMWTGPVDEWGYGKISIRQSLGTHKTVLAHRLAWELRFGPVPRGLCVLHKCDVPCCCNVEHLYLGTNRENAADKQKRPRGYRGDATKRWAYACGEKWKSRVRIGGDMYYLGTYATDVMAHEVAKNFIDTVNQGEQARDKGTMTALVRALRHIGQ